MAQAGDVVSGKYRLIHPLGMGGMGTVWRAEHVALKQLVALKLLHVRGPQAERTVKRFQREAQIAASIRHRNIVYISDFGTDEDEPYIVMELLEGIPLSERMVVGEPLGVGTFLHLVEETLQGLAAVHAAGVVHRDMKPENIFLVRESGGSVFPKLLDFGVSRSTARGQGHTITREGVVMGTPEYVSPEQARGRMADVRSDIYSLGVVMYEALAGRLPFQADNPADLIVAVLNTTPLPLSTFRPELGDVLSSLVAKAMERDPERRYQTAEAMRAAIGALLEAEPELANDSLPRRFLAPSRYPSDSNEQTEPGQTRSATLSEDLGGPAAASAMFALPGQKLRARWIASALGALAVLGLSWALVGGESNAGARGVATRPRAQRAGGVAPVSQASAEAEAPTEVIVELFGLPNDARVKADGAEVEGGSLRFPRDSGEHEIVVEAPGQEPWRVLHDSARDGRYAIAFVPAKRSARGTRAPFASKNGKKTSLLRQPDF